MFAYIVRRVISGILLLIVMSMVTFLLFFAGPVHPENFACGKNCSPALKEQSVPCESDGVRIIPKPCCTL